MWRAHMWLARILLVTGLIQGASCDRKRSFWLQFWITVERPGNAFGQTSHDLGAIWGQFWGVVGERDWRKQVLVLGASADCQGARRPVHGHWF